MPSVPPVALPRAAFHAESFAPWCERARWALDHHRIAYDEIDEVPLFAELTLRLALRRLRGRVTVPALVHGGERLMGSDDIARHAEARGSGATLFVPQVETWMAVSERLMISGRALLLPRMARDTEALAEQLPKAVPRALRGAFAPAARMGVAHLMTKYEVHEEDGAEHEHAMRSDLSLVRTALRGGKHLLGDRLSYADITIAAALQFVCPVDDRFIHLGPASRRAWTHDRLAVEAEDLLAWRDRLYADHRRT